MKAVWTVISMLRVAKTLWSGALVLLMFLSGIIIAEKQSVSSNIFLLSVSGFELHESQISCIEKWFSNKTNNSDCGAVDLAFALNINGIDEHYRVEYGKEAVTHRLAQRYSIPVGVYSCIHIVGSKNVKTQRMVCITQSCSYISTDKNYRLDRGDVWMKIMSFVGELEILLFDESCPVNHDKDVI